ncbi:alpha/beta hydrolase [Actinocorallia sp. API 0066]|uniref:alpha/beta fold hydrolase n=1 Tax=Actinocorallia sp. API 0066 TaxID=2896846 RepID=UPI001E631937|nr:alpha/beta hydrolase [Actinocorallia sp. API 0066]MCD0453449.1 alpha/beta hydrolase [Actinocorallia sp. API 0066]
MTTIVLVHGAWAGPWVWDTLLRPLADAGHSPLPVHLPGTGTGQTSDVTLDTLARAVIDQLDGIDGPLVLVGHSGGSVIATQVAERICDRVAGVAHVAGIMLPSGRSFAEICAEAGLTAPVGISAHLDTTPDGRHSIVSPEAGAAVFFHQAEPAAAIAAARRLVPQMETARLITPTWTPTRYGRLPKLYIEARADRSIPLPAQHHMQTLTPPTKVVSLNSDHAPQLSAPLPLTTALATFATSPS